MDQKLFPFVPLAVALVGAVFGDRDFVKLHLGPIYISEWLYLLSAVLFATSAFWRKEILRRKGLFKPLVPILAFSVWGFIRLALDVVMAPGSFADPAVRVRMLQHALIFVYPLLWIPPGVLLSALDRKAVRSLAVILLAAHGLMFFIWGNIRNLSVGPIFGILYIAALDDLVWSGKRRKLKDAAALAAIGFLAFWPFWTAWGKLFQRTTLAVFLLFVTVYPIILRWSRTRAPLRSFAQGVGVGLASLAILIGGFAGNSAAHGRLAYFYEDFIKAFKHGDDQSPDPNYQPIIRLQSRRFFWDRAVQQWQAHPVIGIGMVPEVPDLVPPGVPNNGGFEGSGTPPVSGPHCSYLNILTRLGLPGILLFLVGVASWVRALWRGLLVNRTASRWDWLAGLLPAPAFFYSVLNVGFESPHHCLVAWFFVGTAFAAIRTPARSTSA